MKASNLTTDHNRYIRLTDLPKSQYTEELDEFVIEIRYLGENSGRKAVPLDNVIIPEIIRRLNDGPTKQDGIRIGPA